MLFWQLWEVLFQAFMIFIGVGVLWMRFIEPYIPSRQTSVLLMIITAVALATVRIVLGVRKIRKGRKEYRDMIASLMEPVQEAE